VAAAACACQAQVVLPSVSVRGRPGVAHLRRRCRREPFVHEVPVDQLRQEFGDVVGTAVLVVEIIGVRPHVDNQERRLAAHQRQIGIGGRDHAEHIVVEHEPEAEPTVSLCEIGYFVCRS
jgi:hypothetical protein